MVTKVGDEIIVDGRHIDDPSKKGEVLDVLHTGGVEHYLIRWDDGHEGIFYPGADAHSVHPGRGGGTT
ncbi:MAG TPA: DUF1918 domain-containing protein [Candidatus Elarobacter sp.]|nr:DUF1918 domain-containing protein [Candidatus Elarobacter sp.]